MHDHHGTTALAFFGVTAWLTQYAWSALGAVAAIGTFLAGSASMIRLIREIHREGWHHRKPTEAAK